MDKKISESVIEISKVVPETTTTVQYKRGFIEQQIKNIQKQKDDFDAQRDIEIAECQDILSKMDALGIVALVEPLLDPVVKITP